MKIIILITNVLSAIQILLYPFVWAVVILMSEYLLHSDSWQKYIHSFCIFLTFTYPVIVIAAIYFSRKYQSLGLALLGFIPLLVFILLSYGAQK